MDIMWTKILVAVLFFFLRLIFGLLPIKLYSYLGIWEKGPDGTRRVNNERKKYANCGIILMQSFGGGVLFATCFLHMMPEIYYAMHELEEHYEVTGHYPRSQLNICVGFFLIYFIEDICQFVIDKFSRCENGSKHPDTISATKSHADSVTQVLPVFEDKIQYNDDKKEKDDKSTDSGLSSNEDFNNQDSIPAPAISLPINERDLTVQLEKAPDKLLRCILITMALSFHAIFEGIAIGLQKSVYNIWYTFIAISIHSITQLFTVGVQLLFSHKTTLVIFYFVLAMSLTSPLGIMIGLAVTVHSSDESMAPAIASVLLEALSAGALLYITFFEVLTEQKEISQFRLTRGLFIILGFSVMALIELLD